MLDFLNRQFKRYYVPRREISIDETLVATRGRTQMIQYIPTKVAKFGVKFWVLAESLTGYIMHMECYLGRRYQPTPPGQSQGTNVVMKLLNVCNLERKFYHIVCDSFFTSINLAKGLFERRTLLTGTIRANRPLPRSIKFPTVQAGQSHYVRQGEVLLLAYKNAGGARKPVRLLSTMVSADVNQAPANPRIVSVYNQNMGGVDAGDMMMSFYESRRKTIKVYKRIMIHLIHRALLNAYVIYKENTNERGRKSLVSFTRKVIRDLSADHMRMNRRLRPQRQRRRIQLHIIAGTCDIYVWVKLTILDSHVTVCYHLT